MHVAVYDTGHWMLETVEFVCGRRAKRAWIADIILGRLDRCRECCRRLGLPDGEGPPVRDIHCRKVMGVTGE